MVIWERYQIIYSESSTDFPNFFLSMKNQSFKLAPIAVVMPFAAQAFVCWQGI